MSRRREVIVCVDDEEGVLRVLREGGYEANDSMIYYGQPGPFAESVEENVMNGVHSVLERVGVRRGK